MMNIYVRKSLEGNKRNPSLITHFEMCLHLLTYYLYLGHVQALSRSIVASRICQQVSL